MDAALVITWKAPFAGREQQALDFGVEVQGYWGKLAADGRCSEPEMFFFPDGTATWMVKGDSAALEALFEAPEAQRLNTKAQLLLADYRSRFGVTARAAEEYLLRYAAAAKELAII